MSTAESNKFYRAFNAFDDIIKRPDLRLRIALKPGDAVLFANRRILHGRMAFELPNLQNQAAARWLRGTYVDWDAVLDKHRVLHKRYSK